MVHRLSSILSFHLANQIGWQDRVGILTYGFELIIGESLKFALLLALAAAWDLLYPTLLVLAFAIPFRLVSGGGHSTTLLRCTILTVFVFLALAAWADYWSQVLDSVPQCLILLTLISAAALTAIWLWVPGRNPARSFDTREQQKFKKLSLLLLLAWIISCIAMSAFTAETVSIKYFASTAAGIMWQVFLVSPLGYIFLDMTEILFNLLMIKKEVNT